MDGNTDQKEGQIIMGNFPLNHKPVDVQLTVHINNLLNCYGKNIIQEFKDKLNNPENEIVGGQTINQLVNHYGLKNVKQWFEVVYGWEFEKAG